jgi:hypothetical protein
MYPLEILAALPRYDFPDTAIGSASDGFLSASSSCATVGSGNELVDCRRIDRGFFLTRFLLGG